MGKKKQKIPIPPQLPPEIADDEVEVSDEDFEFVESNQDYAGFLKRLDTKSITRHVVRVAGQKEDALETLYEQRNKKTSSQKLAEEDGLKAVDPVDVLPFKTLDGKLYYRAASDDSRRSENMLKEGDAASEDKDDGKDKDIVKLTKAERRRKLKKSKREAKKQAKDLDEIDSLQEDTVPENLQSEVLAEVKEELSAEEVFVKKKCKLAEIGMALLADPESNIKSLKDLLQICKDGDRNIVKLGLLSLLAIFKDIIPGYRIRLPTEKELEMTVSKAVQKMRYYESTLLHSYKAYLQKLISLEKQPFFQHVAVRCMCNLLEAVPHFNFRESLLANVIKNISTPDDVMRKLCCAALKSLFADEGKHGGEVTVEAVKLISDHVKVYDCQLHPDCIEVLLSLSFDEDLGRAKSLEEEKLTHKKKKRRQNDREINQLKDNDKKKGKQELMKKTREEVNADLKATSFAPDLEERRTMQSQTLSALFQTYFRIVKRAMDPAITRPKVNTRSVSGGFGRHPLLSPCLKGLGQFSHLIDLDFMSDIMSVLKKLAASNGDAVSSESSLTVSERLQCCIVAFKVMRNNLDALNVDLHEFFIQLYNLLLEWRPDREDQALVTLKHLLQKNVKCRNLLENDAGGGSLSGSIAKYQPDSSDPNLSGALASVLWELSLLFKHYHPAVSSIASSISNMSTAHNQVYLATMSPQQAFRDLSIQQESFNPTSNFATANRKRKKTTGSLISSSVVFEDKDAINEDQIRKKFSDHFMLLRGITENEKLRAELNHTMSSISMYKEYKKQKKKREGSKIRKKV
ncbi:nucleolar complex protein 3 [Cinnamomum micranthum f. kanehirae]|uniref:Nucleolar complex protein 3 n=1 Tax=Cinnamomum micranthum f. kanehirae TaxID=337451 RepID=A0A443PCY5_9MAGN|nr:nucleolar complex protein 3 [Cinnamomum micranthum f. kanehirae]